MNGEYENLWQRCTAIGAMSLEDVERFKFAERDAVEEDIDDFDSAGIITEEQARKLYSLLRRS